MQLIGTCKYATMLTFQRSIQEEKQTAPTAASDVIALYNLSRDVLPQVIEPMGVESFDVCTLAPLHHQCQLSSVTLLQPKTTINHMQTYRRLKLNFMVSQGQMIKHQDTDSPPAAVLGTILYYLTMSGHP